MVLGVPSSIWWLINDYEYFFDIGWVCYRNSKNFVFVIDEYEFELIGIG